MSDIAILTVGIGKRYRIGSFGMHHRLEMIFRKPYHLLLKWRRSAVADAPLHAGGFSPALQEVSFSVRQGETVGIIGANGAGKSALLRILAGVTRPTQGYAEIRGRVSSMLDVGTGFHPELTGKENIYLSGAILGLKKKVIDEKFQDIVLFSGLESFLEAPVKKYSSGMCVRLAFAIAAQLQPKIMLVDEVLSIADLAFKEKCVAKLQEMGAGGCTILLVSHDMSIIRMLCPRTILLDQGKILKDGATEEILDYYALHFRSLVKP
jgi:lipopolysaccharide transport system ATP-binding protein